jgi:pilus assembly protein CpaE
MIVSPDRELTSDLHRVLANTGEVSIVRMLDQYPDLVELSRVLRSHAPQVMFVTLDSPSNVTRLATHVEQVTPGVQIVAVGRSANPQSLIEAMRAGIREFLASPLERHVVLECMRRLKENLSRRPIEVQQSDLLYSFLPAKPGVGATTLAINSTLAATRHDDTTGLLMDFDLNSGMTRFMLKLNSTYSILDAAQHAAAMDENLWPQIATKFGKMDVVHAGTPNPEVRVQDLQIQHLLDFSRRNYKVVSVDLSGNLEKYSLEIMHESRWIFLVCTPEVASLHLAREKLQYLQRMDLTDRVRLLLNRYSKRSPIVPSEVEQVVGAPVMMTFPNDYARVANAITNGSTVDPKSELGIAYDDLAGRMVQRQSPKHAEPTRRFVDYFNISPARFSFERAKT